MVGIALNNVLVPQLRAVIDHDLKGLYDNLVIKHKINTNKNDLFTPEAHGFSYRDAGNDYIVYSHHELAKLFMKKEMVKFKRITDPTFDGSAALNVIENASCFSSALCAVRKVYFSAQPNKLRPILKFRKYYPVEHIFVPACSSARKIHFFKF